MGFEACFRDDDETLARTAFTAEVDFEALRRDGWFKLPWRRRRSPRAASPRLQGKASPAGLKPALTSCPTTNRRSTPALAQRYPLAMISPPARNFLNSSFVNVKSLRDIEAEPLVEIHARRAAARHRRWKHRASSTTAAATAARRSCRRRARPGVVNALGIWWRKLGLDGNNVNELTTSA